MMVQSGDDNCLSTGKEREDRQVQTKNRFDSLQIDVKCPDTAILLLGSRERPVLVAAAAALTKFASKGKENLQTLFELEVVDSLLPLVQHDDLFTRRFAMRLLAEMSAIPFVRNHLLDSDSYLPLFVDTLTKDSDTFVQEFASLILAEISKDPYGTVKILEHCTNFDVIFETMKLLDPDVKKNTAELANNLLKDPTAAERIVASQAFSFPVIYQLLDQPYPAIQSLALSIVDSLVTRSKDHHVQQLFRESGGTRVLLDLLDNIDYADLHSDILKIFVHAAENAETVESLNSGGDIAKLYRYLESSSDSRVLREILDVLVRLASTESGRKALYGLGIVKHLLGYLRKSSRDSELSRVACYGIGMMARHEPAAKEIIQENPIKLILDVLRDENLKWSTRETAVFALKELCISDRKNCQNFLDLGGNAYLQSLLKQSTEEVPPEIQMSAVDILNFMGENSDTRNRLIEVDLIDALSNSFEVKDRAVDELKIACCRALSNYCVEKRAREFCLERNIVKKLFGLLQDVESTPVRAAAVQLVRQLCADSSMAEQFVQAGYLNYMLKNRCVSTILPTWNTCIDALFSAHLPVKFAATGRLSLHDITHDGFYVMRRRICPFPILDELFRLKMCPMEPVYVVNCAMPEFCSNEEQSRSSVECRKSMNSRIAWLEVKFGKIQPDPHLCEYVTLFRCILAANETEETEPQPGIVNISKIASRAKLLGKFVARQMSGPEPRDPCIDHQLDIHVREIREDLETSVIPLGHLRVGSYLERALLFKVIADRIFLPAALVRGEYGKAWIEIPVPEMENTVDNTDTSVLPEILNPRITASKKSLMRAQIRAETTEKLIDPRQSAAVQQEETDKVRVNRDNLKTVLPTRLLQENYIVDLMEKPGDLIPIRSVRARVYRAPISHCVMTCEL